MTINYLTHGRVQLALHTLKDAPGTPLLLLHALGSAAPAQLPTAYESWSGSVYALDFTGHGQSSHAKGGGYSAELLMADVDTALHTLPSCFIVGEGLGAYITLLITGARPHLVKGGLLLDGAGLTGGGTDDIKHILTLENFPPAASAEPTDPYALLELSTDLRMPNYAKKFAELSLLTRAPDSFKPLQVATSQEAPWLNAILETDASSRSSLSDAIALFQQHSQH